MAIPTNNLVSQYDVSALELSDNAKISSVEDLVGSNDLSQESNEKRPTFKTNVTPNGETGG